MTGFSAPTGDAAAAQTTHHTSVGLYPRPDGGSLPDANERCLGCDEDESPVTSVCDEDYRAGRQDQPLARVGQLLI
jgi:hypothetical protein